MDRRQAFHFRLLCLGNLLLSVSSITVTTDTAALRAFHTEIEDPFENLQSWNGDDPCDDSWSGVICKSDSSGDRETVVQLRLLNSNLTGSLPPVLGNLTNLQILDLMWNQISGSIPKELGNLANLQLLLLNGNNLTGTIPDELGYLTQLDRFQIDSNNISGPVPSSFKNLRSVKHIHMNNNTLTGSIPPELGSLPKLLHLLLDNNNLSGALPKELANSSHMTIIQLDNNQFTDAIIPNEYGKIVNLTKLSIRNSNLRGPIPDLNGLTRLQYLDLSHNYLSGELPSFSSENITSIDLSYNLLNGSLPESYGSFPNLQYLVLGNNSLTGSIPESLGTGTVFTTWSGDVVMDFQNNTFSSVSESLISAASQRVKVRLYGNEAICNNSALANPCTSMSAGFFPEDKPNKSVAQCGSSTCVLPAEPVPSAAENRNICFCATPIIVGYRLKSPSFAFFTAYVTQYQDWIASGINLSTDQVHVESFFKMPGPRFESRLKIFPSWETGLHSFNENEIMTIYGIFSDWKLPANNLFGPQELRYFQYGSESFHPGTKLSLGAIIGIAVAGICVLAVVLTLGYLVYHRRTRRMTPERRRLISLAARNKLSSVGGIKIAEARAFTYKELAVATKSFSAAMQVGSGGYGNVYRGNLADGQVVAIKCAKEGSLQGTNEFYTEIELLSRVHHRNLVSLVGYCDDQGEQILVYEFMVNGTLRDHLKPSKSKRALGFSTRLKIALGAARGILYLHTEANPPIFHRDIKATNILLDAKFNAKVADFGLSRLAPTSEIEGSTPGNVSTMVKGTPGYLDPEYMRTQVLTNKSDVYSFGVVLLELITGMEPISFDKNIVREVKHGYENGLILHLVDSRMGAYPAEALEPLVRVALSCCKEDPLQRPTMAEVAHELAEVWRSVPWTDSAPDLDSDLLQDFNKSPSKFDSKVLESDVLLEAASKDFTSIPSIRPR